MSPESKLLVILSTRDIIACCVECFLTKPELIFVNELSLIHEIKTHYYTLIVNIFWKKKEELKLVYKY